MENTIGTNNISIRGDKTSSNSIIIINGNIINKMWYNNEEINNTSPNKGINYNLYAYWYHIINNAVYNVIKSFIKWSDIVLNNSTANCGFEIADLNEDNSVNVFDVITLAQIIIEN